MQFDISALYVPDFGDTDKTGGDKVDKDKTKNDQADKDKTDTQGKPEKQKTIKKGTH